VNGLERRVVDEIDRRVDDLVQLTSELIGFDTTARQGNDPARDEAALQRYLAGRLRARGADVDLWEPEPDDVAGHRMTPPGLRFDGRPQMTARFAGAGVGRHLVLNGHIDAVSAEPTTDWTSDPLKADVRDGKLFGRGACDMKGGVASMVVAAEVLADVGVRLAGDLMVSTVTDEESTGCGALAAVAHGLRADAAIVTEPSDLQAWVVCRGALIATIAVPGRPGHAGMHHLDWRDGGAVNPIDKAFVVLDAARALEAEWRIRHDPGHPLLPPPDIVPTRISAGEWIVSYPASCELVFHLAYLPEQADRDGWGANVMREFSTSVRNATDTDPWLAEHPPTITWAPEVPPAEIAEDHPIVRCVIAAANDIGRASRPTGFHSWYDGATFIRLGATPAVGFGPGSLGVAHTVDEFVPVDELVDCSKAVALTAMRFCA